MRHLVSTRRRVEGRRIAEYNEAWNRLVAAAGGMSFRVNAWRFRSGTDADLHIEFLEFSGETDPRDDPSIGAALRALEELARGVSEEWVDLP